uniref:Cytochrome b/b6 domain-containing protein n=1 Tax=Bosea sp. NBC_00436 TaxID=2969620 RepID=A0A9E8CNI6_9HYPH
MTMTADSPAIAPAAVRRIGGHAFPLLAKVLHWSTAVLVLVMFCVGILMKEIGSGPWADALMTFHKTAGFALLLLVLGRLAYRIVQRFTGRWSRSAGGRAVHRILYGMLVVIPLLGLAGVSDFGARDIYGGLSLPAIWPRGAGYADELFRGHAILAFGLIGLVALHICLALDDYIRQAPAAHPKEAVSAEASSLQRADVP